MNLPQRIPASVSGFEAYWSQRKQDQDKAVMALVSSVQLGATRQEKKGMSR